MLYKFSYVLGIFILLKCAQSSRILGVIPSASYSHQVFYHQIWKELAIRGHEVVVITTDPSGEKHPNLREINVRESYGPTKELVDIFINTSIITILTENLLMKKSANIIDFQMALPQVQELLNNKSEHFDLLMVEHLQAVPYAFKYRFNCPMIGMVSMDGFTLSHNSMGNPIHDILYPLSIFPVQTNLTFLERVGSFFVTKMFQFTVYRNSEEMNRIIRKYFGDDAPDLYTLVEETDMLFINANPLFTQIRPLTPATINLAGGIHMKPPKPLPEDLKKYLDSNEEGVIYFSLGSNVKSKELTPELRQTILETFKQIPYKILWKYEDDQLPGKPTNVKIIKWAPQQDVLRHRNIKLFITQGGIQSLEEALYSHVPLVVIPFFGDQEANANKLKERGLGIVLNRFNLNILNFKEAIMEVLQNSQYKTNVIKLANMIQDEPMKPIDRAIWWAEYVIRHNGAKHLKGPKLPFYQYYYLDICLFFVLLMIILTIALYRFIHILKLWMTGKTHKSKLH